MEPSPFCDRCRAPHPPGTACADLGEAPTLPPGSLGPIPLVHVAPGHDLIGLQVGSFRIERLLGRGGMGAVYLARHPAIGSQVAVKFIRPEFAADPMLVRRLYAEARAANLATHENIVRILDLGEHPTYGLYLVMEYVEGEPLSLHLQRGPLDLAAAEPVLLQLCAAVGTAHARGVIHRDLKPDNVMVRPTRSGLDVKVMDFGIAKLREAGTASGTVNGAILGTPEYIAPEQCDGRTVDARTDIYSLGVMAYELATGRLPFSGSPARLMIAHLTQPPPPPRSVRPDLPGHWEAAILRAMSKRPEDRFQSTQEFAAAIAGRRACTPPPSGRAAEVRHKVTARVEVQLAPGRPPVQLTALDVSRGGALLAYDGEPPALFSRIALRLGTPPMEVSAEVVRQVTDVEARAWGTEPGFAVQFCGREPALAACIDAMTRGQPEVELPEPPPGGALNPQQRLLLGRYAAQSTSSHYEVLNLPLDATRAQVVDAGRRAVAELRELEARPLTPAHADQVRASLQRVASAVAVLTSVRERLQYDARRANLAGITQAIANGCPERLLREERERFLRERPEVEARLAELLARARIASQQGKMEAAARELREALRLDPLNLELHGRLGSAARSP